MTATSTASCSGDDAQVNANKLDRSDMHWILGLYGTAIGAGTLFLPINAGIGGVWPLIMIALLAFPATYFSHRGLMRFVLSGAKEGDRDMTVTFKRHFGRTAGSLLTVFYFFAVFPLLLVYSVALTNTVQSLLIHQFGWSPIPRGWLSLLLMGALVLIARGGQQRILKTMSLLVYPFIIALVALGLFLIPQWKGEFLATASAPINWHHMTYTLWLAIPVMVFSFNHSPMISAFSVAQYRRYGDRADQKGSRMLAISHLLMVITVMFFVFSCVMTVSPSNLAEARDQNVTILSYLANYLGTPVIAYAAPIIALVAISKSFLGHYIGAEEGARGLLGNRGRGVDVLVSIMIFVACWMTATLDPSILDLIENLGGPVIAVLLFLVPMAAVYSVPALAKYKGAPSNILVIAVGLIAVSGMLYKFLS
ncbi:hypothetical protein [Carnimonas bestiolae]|uniref:hypothetical protein n=1 Tax=Carnimonas bestiolae TaxID=3402172 RepID=UPI003EDBA11A